MYPPCIPLRHMCSIVTYVSHYSTCVLLRHMCPIAAYVSHCSRCVPYVLSIPKLKLLALACRSHQNTLDPCPSHLDYIQFILPASRTHLLHALHIRLHLINISCILIYTDLYFRCLDLS